MRRVRTPWPTPRGRSLAVVELSATVVVWLLIGPRTAILALGAGFAATATRFRFSELAGLVVVLAAATLAIGGWTTNDAVTGAAHARHGAHPERSQHPGRHRHDTETAHRVHRR